MDSNVFIFAFERPKSNSHRIVAQLVSGGLRGVVTDRIVREVMQYFRRYYDKDLAARYRDLLLLTCDLVLEQDLEIRRELEELVGTKDVGALAAVRELGVSRLISTDSDFSRAPEHRTPRAYLREQGLRPYPGDE